MSKTDIIKVDGEVVEVLPNATFRVEIENGSILFCHLSGKMRTNFIKVILGDKVGVEMSVYDLTKGRIYKRY